MKVLIAPLNWGLGHATRCVSLIHQYREQGHEVILGGDGDSLLWLKRYFPTLRLINLAPLSLSYSSGNSQVGAMLKAWPVIVRFSLSDHYQLKALQTVEHFDLIISDNRFGLYTSGVRCIYMTHQLTIRLPRPWRWLEPLAYSMHKWVYRHYDEVWVPDYAQQGLSGELGHPKQVDRRVRYIGPQSRFEHPFELPEKKDKWNVVAVLSGLEPQRSIFEQELADRYSGKSERVLIVRGKIGLPQVRLTHGNVVLVPWLKDEDLVNALCGADKVIVRSGYSSIMDMQKLGLLQKTEFHPTPGQSEQEYLAEWLPHYLA